VVAKVIYFKDLVTCGTTVTVYCLPKDDDEYQVGNFAAIAVVLSYKVSVHDCFVWLEASFDFFDNFAAGFILFQVSKVAFDIFVKLTARRHQFSDFDAKMFGRRFLILTLLFFMLFEGR